MNNDDVNEWLKKNKFNKKMAGEDKFANIMTEVSTPFLALCNIVETKCDRKIMINLLENHILGLLLTLTDSNDEAIMICNNVIMQISDVDKQLNS